MIEPRLMMFAYEHCCKYPTHNMNDFIKHTLHCNHILLGNCCLVQYDMVDGKRNIHSVYFSDFKCDFKLSTYALIKCWFSQEENVFLFEPIHRFNKILGLS
jgi:hypothetical protein